MVFFPKFVIKDITSKNGERFYMNYIEILIIHSL